MRRFRTFSTILLAALALAAVAGWALQRFAGDLAIHVDPARLQPYVAERFPIRHCQLVLACVEFRQPQLSAPTGQDRLRLDTQIAVQAAGQEYPGRAGLSGRLRYEPQGGAFYIDDLTVTGFELTGVPESYAGLVRAFGPQAVQATLRDLPLYTLDRSTTTGAWAHRLIRDVRVVDGQLRVTFFPSDS